MTNSLSIKVYVASLHHYNCGELRGAWIELPCGDLEDRIKQLLAGQEEYAIHDFEVTGLPELNKRIREYTGIFVLNEQAEALEKLSKEDLDRVNYLLWDGEELDGALAHYEDVSVYPDSTLSDVAEEFVDEGFFGHVPDALKGYIDYDAIGRDLRIDGYVELYGNVYKRND